MSDVVDFGSVKSFYPATGRMLSPRATACVTAEKEGILVRCDDSKHPAFWLETVIPWEGVHDLLAEAMPMLVADKPDLFTKVETVESDQQCEENYCPQCGSVVSAYFPALFCGSQCVERFAKRMEGVAIFLSQERFSIMKVKSQTFHIDLELGVKNEVQ